jgi:phage-related protein
MTDGQKRIPASFYRSGSGSEPVREWLKELKPEDRHSIGLDIMRVEYGWPIGMPVCRPLKHGLCEVRSSISDGRIARVIFCVYNERMVLLHGFIKKSQKTPLPDLDLALKRKKEVEQQ